jgi:cyclohexyl-isocyanide hydratase
MIPHDTHLHIGSLLFEGVDQIDLTGPFEVLSRIPNATYCIYSKTAAPVRDLKGLRLTPDATLADATSLSRQARLARIEGLLARQPNVAILN